MEDSEYYEAQIEDYKNRINELNEYYQSIIEQKDDEIADLKNEIMEMRYS